MYMYFENILDKFVSNVIVYVSYILTYLLWYSFFFHLALGDQTLILYLPNGIIILSFLFFGNKIILGLFLSQISLYIISLKYNLDLPYNDYLIISLFQLICMPLTFFILHRFGITIGTDRNDKLDKTNYLHVLIITFLCASILGIFLISSTLFLVHQINLLAFVLGSFLGGAILILTMKILVNIIYLLITFFKNN